MISIRSSLWDYFFYNPSRAWLFQPDRHSREITVITKDKKQLICLFFETMQPRKAGSIFMLHGRGGNASTYASYIKPLLHDGYDVFLVDWRGYGKSTGRPGHRTVIADTEAALDRFLQLPGTGSNKKILFGLSLGGQVAIHLAKQHPGLFDALITEGAIASFHGAVVDYYPGFWGWLFKWFISLPYAAEEDIQSLDDLPKLILHSTDDKKISFAHAEILYEKALPPKTLLKLEGRHLCGLNPPQTTMYLSAIRKLLHQDTVTGNKQVWPH